MKLYILAITLAILAPTVSGSQKKGILDDIFPPGLLRGSGSSTGNGDSLPEDSGEQSQMGHRHNEGDDPPPDGFPRGSKVTINGLHSAVALNGQTAIVHGYDTQKQRYLLELHDGTPKEVKGTHLSLFGLDQPSVPDQLRSDSTPAGGIPVGTHATIFGLKSAVQLNGQEVVVKGFDSKKQRYIVQTADGSPKEVKASHLGPLSDNAPTMESQQPRHVPRAEDSRRFRVPSPVVPETDVPEKSDSNGMPALPEGAKVRIVGLHSAKKLNGEIVTVHDIDVKTGRYMVELPDGSPKEIKREHLLLPSEVARVEALKNAAASPVDQGKPLGPNNWAFGTSVLISGLHSAAELNGKVGSVRGFDEKMQRYIVVVPGGGPPKKVKPQNLHLAGSGDAANSPSQVQPQVQQPVQLHVVQPQVTHPEAPLPKAQTGMPSGQVSSSSVTPAMPVATVSSGQLVPGTHVLVSGLVSAPQLNGQVAVVRNFDEKTGRYVVEFSAGSKPKKIKESHLKIVDTPKMSLGAQAAVVTKPKPKQQRLAVCNAYPYNAPLGAFLLSPDGDSYIELFTGIPYQGCTDVDLPDGAQNATLEFTIDKLQVARQSLKGTKALKNPETSLVLVVYRKDPNTLKAAVLANTVTPRPEVYTLLVFNAYRGADLFELRANRGGLVQELKLNKAYRLNKEQHLDLTLTNGFHDLNLAFEPRKGRIYAAVCTGVAEGLKGEPRNLGFVVHELGDWTASEQMSDDAKQQQVNTAPPVLALQEEESQDSQTEPDNAPPKKSAAVAVPAQVFALLLGVVLLQ